MASVTLQSRFLPFVMAKDEPEFRSVAIRCATECEAWARAIREYAELGGIPARASMVRGQDYSSTHDFMDEGDEVDGEFESDEEVEVDEEIDDLGF
ncbi:MAG: hypothetical protein WBM44_01515 [Waterburya sp.]